MNGNGLEAQRVNLPNDSSISMRVSKIDNDLAPFHKSLSCWSLTAMWALIIVEAFKKYARWQAAEMFFTLLVVASAAIGLLLYARIRLTLFLKEHPAGYTGEFSPAMRLLSNYMVRMAGVLLMVILFVIGSR